MLQPAGPQVAPPVVLDPAPNGCLPEVTPGFLAFDPFELADFQFTVDVNAGFLHGTLSSPPVLDLKVVASVVVPALAVVDMVMLSARSFKPHLSIKATNTGLLRRLRR